jgi:ribosome-associated protein
MLKINRNLSIPESETAFRFSSSSKPGGQNVNKVSTRATLLFDVEASRSLSVRQKPRIKNKLKTRINKEGVLRVSSQKHRSQGENRKAANERFIDLLRNSLKRSPRRKPTRKPKAVKEQRLKSKKERGRLKKLRLKVNLSGKE